MKTDLPGSQRGYNFFWLALGFIIFTGCANTKKVIYFDNVQDGSIASAVTNLEPVIQKSDILSISVSSLSTEATVIFNAPNIAAAASGASSGNVAPATGYLVNNEGNIQFPILGNIQAAGLTKQKLKENITKSLVDRKLLVDPIVNIRYLNFRVTVLGEVARPTVVTVPNERISILEAIGLAGDLTIYAKRDNVLLIREEGGNKVIRRLNLNSADIFSSQYYYLKSNDIIYAEPNNARVAASSRTQQLLPIILSSLSFFAIIIDRVIQ
jgi:polysaccharide biosynthesis/export protein